MVVVLVVAVFMKEKKMKGSPVTWCDWWLSSPLLSGAGPRRSSQAPRSFHFTSGLSSRPAWTVGGRPASKTGSSWNIWKGNDRPSVRPSGLRADLFSGRVLIWIVPARARLLVSLCVSVCASYTLLSSIWHLTTALRVALCHIQMSGRCESVRMCVVWLAPTDTHKSMGTDDYSASDLMVNFCCVFIFFFIIKQKMKQNVYPLISLVFRIFGESVSVFVLIDKMLTYS